MYTRAHFASIDSEGELRVDRVRAVRVLIRHLLSLRGTGQLRFRSETFGLYYPALPYRRPWWHISPRGVLLLAEQARQYAAWVLEMDRLRDDPGAGWWLRRGGSPVGWADPSTDVVHRGG
jgi:hypothetical protein